MITKKALGRVEVKDAGQGLVTAVFSTFNVVDADGDVTLPGAFDDGAEWMISAYGHKSWDGALPVGKGVVRASDTEAVLEGQFFMDTVDGRETFLVVKNMGDLQEWSYSCQPDRWSYGEFEGQQVRFLEHIVPGGEVSPVIKGAGVGTRTTAVKNNSDGQLINELEAALEAMGVVTGAFDSARRVDALRAEKGKTLSRVNLDALDKLGDLIRKASEAHASLKADRQPAPEPTPPALQTEWLRHIARQRGIHVA